jgi:CheY-like chemotaxis protein
MDRVEHGTTVLRASRRARHTAFIYATQGAYVAHVVDFVGRGARDGERMVIITARAGWDEIAARLETAQIDWAHAARRGNLVTADAATLLERTVRDGVFERARFDAELQSILGNGHAHWRLYSDAASLLVARDNLPAALALEYAEHEFVHQGATRISCGFGLHQFPETEHDWQVRSIINAHEDAVIEREAWSRPVPPGPARRTGNPPELILLWDDHADTRSMYAEALTFSGYRVMTAADASQAFMLGLAYRPDLLVLDVRLPAKLAVTTMRRLKAADDFKAPILALTAHAFDAERDTIFNDGFDVVLSKPCLPDALVAAVAKALDRPSGG